MSRLNSVTDVTLLIANKLFLQENYKIQEAFNTVAVQQFSSEVELLDFKQSEAAATSINAWVEDKTNNNIKDIINPADLTEDSGLVLVNAIYFKGKWELPFEVRYTKIEEFYLNDVDKVDVQMMYTKREFFNKNDPSLNAKVVKLPYSNKDINLIVVLPNERNGIAELEKKLADTDITKLTENMHYLEVVVGLPKFKMEQTIDLQGPLTELGLGVIFNREADLSGITGAKNGSYVSKVIQKAFIEVNEQGAEITCATAHLRPYCMPPPCEEFIADHPFFIILGSRQEDVTIILFEGRVSKPDVVLDKTSHCKGKVRKHRKTSRRCTLQ